MLTLSSSPNPTVEGSVWFYAPNKGAPVFFAAAFLLSGSFHLYQTVRHKSWRLTTLYVICAVIFVAGFVAREQAAFDYDNLDLLLASVCLVYAAPPLCELANYVVLGRILYYVPYHSPIHPGRVLTTFTAVSLVVEMLNGIGVSYSTNQGLSRGARQTGAGLMKAALILQLIVVVLFVALLTVFLRRCRKAGSRNENVRQAALTLYISSAIITVRIIYRTVEYFDLESLLSDPGSVEADKLSPIVRYEWFFYVFESSLMLLNSVLMNWRHPTRWLPRSNKVYLSKNDGVTEVDGPGYKDGRNFLVTFLDPFDVYGLIRGRDKKNMFWEHEGADLGVDGGRKELGPSSENAV
ncbi:hypothetical protein MKZ38_005420 [Zalerion maritima]|uniref:Uncharacterized protein n=1 Tax=Zalerion maritima TaxID=339359 RepID=A0AAD5RKG8_9PEZI|nr:hypothetical protein MKZ38_005420 [Zalerion maritima]